jgi:hypothetical protein
MSNTKSENYGENSMRRANGNRKTEADHVDVKRPLKQLPITVWELLLIPMYVPLCNNLSNRINKGMEVGRTPIQINMMMTQMQLRDDASAANCKLNEFKVGDR